MRTSVVFAIIIYDTAAWSGVCHVDTECKGDRLCQGGACVAPAAESSPGAPFALGPYISASVGGGYLAASETTMSGTEVTVSAFTAGLRGLAGVALSPRVAVYLRFGYDPSLTTPNISVGGRDVPATDASIAELSIGPGLSYFWSPSDSVAIAPFASKLSVSSPGKSSSTDWGFGACIGAAKDWPVAPGLRLGLTSELSLGEMTDSSPTGNISTTAYAWSIGVSARH